MQVSTKWLKDFLNIDCTTDELAEKFTMAGLPVENVIKAYYKRWVDGRFKALKLLKITD